MTRAARGPGANLDGREVTFLSLYYGHEQGKKGNLEVCALAAGYPEKSCEARGREILRKYEDFAFRMAARAVGISKPYLALKLKKILDLDENKHSNEILRGIRLCLANMGELVEQVPGTSGNTGDTFNGPVMVIVGASAERMRALKEAIPPMTQAEKERMEQEENERVNRRLEMLRNGIMPPLERLANGSLSQKHAEVLDMQPVVVSSEPRLPDIELPHKPGSGPASWRQIPDGQEEPLPNFGDADAGGPEKTEA